VIHFLFATAGGFHFQDLFHPLRYWGYQFWSGIGSDIGEVAIIGGLITIVRHLNCHAKGCYRLGGHQVAGTPYKTCRKHHPHIPNERVTAEHIAAAADKALYGTPVPSEGDAPAPQ
jgi:hypothetical protein